MTGRVPLLLLPGNMCDARQWEPLQRDFDSAGWRSSVADLSCDDRISAMADRALDSIDGRIVPVGFSMGAIVALEMVRRAPQRIAALAMFALNATADLPERAAARPRQQHAVRAGRLAQVVGEELKPNYLAVANRGNSPLLALTMAMALDLGPDTFVRQSEALRTRADLRPVLPTIACSVFLACGAEDRLCPPQWHEDWRKAIGHGELEIISDAGHLLPLEQPERLGRALLGWLETIEVNA